MHKRNNSDIVQQTIELINNYNAGKERCLILMRNFNEIEDRHTPKRRVGDCVREAGALHNNFSKTELSSYISQKEAIYLLNSGVTMETIADLDGYFSKYGQQKN